MNMVNTKQDGTGRPPLVQKTWIPGRATQDCDPGLPRLPGRGQAGMTIELCDELLRHHTRLSNQSAIRLWVRFARLDHCLFNVEKTVEP